MLTITLSYAAFALAMGFGHILLWRYARNPAAARARITPMHFWLYRRAPARCAAARRRHDSRWRLGELFVGQVLGLGSEGDVGADRAALLHPARCTAGSPGWWTQFGLVVASVVCFLAVLMACVWRELCARQRLAQLRVRHRRRDVCCDVCHCPDLLFVSVRDLAISQGASAAVPTKSESSAPQCSASRIVDPGGRIIIQRREERKESRPSLAAIFSSVARCHSLLERFHLVVGAEKTKPNTPADFKDWESVRLGV